MDTVLGSYGEGYGWDVCVYNRTERRGWEGEGEPTGVILFQVYASPLLSTGVSQGRKDIGVYVSEAIFKCLCVLHAITALFPCCCSL